MAAPPNGDGDETLGVVDFSIFPHLGHPSLPDNTLANAEKWAAALQKIGVDARLLSSSAGRA